MRNLTTQWGANQYPLGIFGGLPHTSVFSFVWNVLPDFFNQSVTGTNQVMNIYGSSSESENVGSLIGQPSPLDFSGGQGPQLQPNSTFFIPTDGAMIAFLQSLNLTAGGVPVNTSRADDIVGALIGYPPLQAPFIRQYDSVTAVRESVSSLKGSLLWAPLCSHAWRIRVAEH